MKIVVGYHMTPFGKAAIDRAVVLAGELSASVHLVGAAEAPTSDTKALNYRSAVQTIEKQLQESAGAIERQGVDCQVHVPVGARGPAHAILLVANEQKADLVVIGMRKRSRVGKLVLGSVAQEVLLDSPCDILAVKQSL